MRHRPELASLVLLSVSTFFVICTEILPVGLLPEIAAGLRVTPATTGLLVTAYAVLVALLSVPVAAFVERWPRRLVIAALLGTYALSNVGFSLAPGYPLAVVARVVGGVAHAGFFAVAVAAAVGLVDRARAGRAVAVVMVGNASALVVGIPLGTALGTALGWRSAFGVLAAVFVLLALAVLRVLPREASARSSEDVSVLQGVRQPAVVAVAVVVTLLALGHFTLYTYVSPLLLHAGVGMTAIGPALFGYGCGGLLGLAAASVVVTRHPEGGLLADMVLMALSLALAAVVDSAPGLVVVLVVWGIAFGAFPTLTQTVMLRAAGRATDAAPALVNATTNVGIAGGAFLGSRLLGVAPVPTLGWVGAGLVVAALGVYAGTRRRPV